MSFISPKQTKYLSLIAAILSILIAVLTLMGLLAILNTGQLSIFNVEAVVITSPDEGAIYNVNDTVLFTVIFNPSVLEGQATDYFVIASSSGEIFFQEEGIRLAYNTAFTISRTFTPNIPAEITLRATMTVGGTDYYNELTITVIDPMAEETTAIETTTGIETSPSFEFLSVLGLILVIMCVKNVKKRKGVV